MNHTQTPWSEVSKPTGSQTLIMTYDDYDHARRCVNVHEDLLDALTQLEAWFDAPCKSCDAGLACDVHGWRVIRARAAIALARKGKR